MSSNGGRSVEAIHHDESTHKNIPTAEYESVLQKEQKEQKDPVAGPANGATR